MQFIQQIIHDYDRLMRHYDIVTLYNLFFQHVLAPIGLVCIVLGLLAAGYDFPDAAGGPNRRLRRVALAGALSLVGVAIYIAVPVWLDYMGYSPVQGHLRFYGLFFIPVGALAGVLAVWVGSQHRFFASTPDVRLPLFSWRAAAAGAALMWVVFFAYSRLVLASSMILSFALLRSTVTSVLAALLFGVAPFFIHEVEKRPVGHLQARGFAFLVAGGIMLVLAQAATLVLGLHGDVL